MSLEIQSRVPVKRKCQFTKALFVSEALDLSIKADHIHCTNIAFLFQIPNSVVMLWCLSNHHCVLIKERVLGNLEVQHKVGMKITI